MNFSDILAMGPMVADKKIRIQVVADEHCPHCGRVGRPKVQHLDGNWAWKCPSTRDECDIAYYTPADRTYELKLSEADERAMRDRIRREVDEQMKDRIWISKGNCSRTIHKDEAIPDGWHLTGTEGTD